MSGIDDGDSFNALFDDSANRTPEQVERDYADFLLFSQLKYVVHGEPYIDPDDEIKKQHFNPCDISRRDTALLVLNTIERQLRVGTPSNEALGFLAFAFEKFLNGSAETLDEAFFIKQKVVAGGQRLPEEKLRSICQAYLDVIHGGIFIYEEGFNTPLREPLTDELQRRAEFSAYTVWRKLTPRKPRKGGENDGTDDNSEIAITQTVRPILKECGVYLKTEQKSRNRKRGVTVQ